MIGLLCAVCWGRLSFAADVVPEKVVGSWEFEIAAGGEIYDAHAKFELVEEVLGGRFEFGGRRNKILRSYVKDGIFFFETRVIRFSEPASVTFACQLEGETMSGEVDFVSVSRSQSYRFTGQRKDRRRTTRTAMPIPAPRPAESDPPQAETRSLQFRQGVNGYQGVTDTEVWEIAPSQTLFEQGTMTTDGNNGGGESQVLMRFGDFIGPENGSVPKHCRITKATLTVVAFDPGTTVYVHRLLVPWSRASTWNGLNSGISVDNVEASTVRDGFTFGQITMDKQTVEFDVSATVQKWVDGAANHGWVFRNTGTNGWDFYSSDWLEVDLRPLLSVEFQKRSSR